MVDKITSDETDEHRPPPGTGIFGAAIFMLALYCIAALVVALLWGG